MNAVAEKALIVSTDSVMSAIREYTVAEHFTTHDIARYMGVGEYPVRAAFTRLIRCNLIEIVPGVRTRRYRTQPAGRRLHGNDYTVAVYRVKEQSGEADFQALMGVFCRG